MSPTVKRSRRADLVHLSLLCFLIFWVAVVVDSLEHDYTWQERVQHFTRIGDAISEVDPFFVFRSVYEYACRPAPSSLYGECEFLIWRIPGGFWYAAKKAYAGGWPTIVPAGVSLLFGVSFVFFENWDEPKWNPFLIGYVLLIAALVTLGLKWVFLLTSWALGKIMGTIGWSSAVCALAGHALERLHRWHLSAEGAKFG